jgi:putative nucleotidyltransferase with HDIG domain
MNLPNRQEVLNLIDKYSDYTKQHLLQVWVIMEYFAEKLGEDKDYWWTVWVLHDIDRDHINKDWDKHLQEDLDKIAGEINLPEEIIDDIKSHWFKFWLSDIEPNTLVRKYLSSVDELSWFIWAYFRMIPSDNPMDIKPKSINKKLKDKSFASWVDRGEARNCETMLDIPVSEFVEDIKIALSKGEFKK